MNKLLPSLVLFLAACAQAADPAPIQLPPGFHIQVFADQVSGARSLRLGSKGTVFVASAATGAVYALRDTDADGQADQRYTLAAGLNRPNGLAYRDGTLYVAELDRILKYPDIERDLSRPPMPQVVRADLPKEGHHGARYIGFGPDGKLYMGIGAPCNVCVPEHFKRGGAELEYGSITRMNVDGTDWEIYARGVRNSVGFDWQPSSGHFWFTDNGRDLLGDDLPADELNRAIRPGLHFGFPYCHAGDLADPELGKGKSCGDYTPPVAKLGAHVASLGMRFYTGSMFPPAYRNQVFVAKHGSWNRSSKVGYSVNLIRIQDGKVVSDEPFASGWLTRTALGSEQVSGRPVDVLVMPDGALLISDDAGGRIYRVYYQP